MIVSPDGVALIRAFEGLRLNAYRDSTGLWTVGYGHTLTAIPGMVVTPEQAESLLQSDAARTASQVSRMLGDTSTNQNQFDALVDFAFNEGSHKLLTSTLLKFFLLGKTDLAAAQFDRWIYIAGRVSEWQIQRREADKALFLKPTAVV